MIKNVLLSLFFIATIAAGVVFPMQSLAVLGCLFLLSTIIAMVIFLSMKEGEVKNEESTN